MDDLVDLPDLFAVLLAAKLMLVAVLVAILLRMRQRMRRTLGRIQQLEGQVTAQSGNREAKPLP